jgi:type IV pilus assembly protein PilY1
MKLVKRLTDYRSWATATLLFLIALPHSGADDTDIYINLSNADNDKPMIMFSLEYRASVNSAVCDDEEWVPGDDTPEDDTPCATLIREGYLHWPARRSFGNESGKYAPFEIYQALLKKVMEHPIGVEKDEFGNDVILLVKDVANFGFMLNHDDGPPSCDSPDATGCSNGGFILSKFRDLSCGADYASRDDCTENDYKFFFDALNSIPIPQSKWEDLTDMSYQSSLCGVKNADHTEEHKYQGAELFFEFFRYLTGQDIHFGHVGYTDFGTDHGINMDSDFLSVPHHLDGAPTCEASPMWDTDAEDPANPGQYLSPLKDLTGQCGADIYTFNFLFDVSQKEDGANCAILETRTNGGMDGLTGNPNNCGIDGAQGPAGLFGPIISWLHDADLGVSLSAPDPTQYGDVPRFFGQQNVTSYFFVPKVGTTSNAYANAGGTGNAIAMDLSDVEASLNTIIDVLEQILSVSTTFVSPTLPSNVFNRTDLLNQVYIAIFKADAHERPRWTGNLKRLYINEDDPTNPYLAGVNEDGSISTDSAVAPDGRIKTSALTTWTYPADIPAPPNNTQTDYEYRRDGRSTQHGGAGGVIPGYRDTSEICCEPGETNVVDPDFVTDYDTSRKIYTEPDIRASGGVAKLLRAFNADAATALEYLKIGDGTPAAVDGVSDDYKQIKIDLWRTVMPYELCEGYDELLTPEPANCDNYNVAFEVDQMEALGYMKDVLAYGRGYVSFGGEKREWFMGDPLHSRPIAVNYGGDSAEDQVVRLALTTNDGALHFFREEDGVEEWAFTPRVVARIQHRLQKNTLSTTPLHPYTMDSSAVAVTIDADHNSKIDENTDDRVYLYSGLRRGGKEYYALDVTNYDLPKMLWSIRKGDPGFEELGQTWSEPRPITIQYDNGLEIVETLALIFAGGYNGDDDGDKEGDLGKDGRDDPDDLLDDEAFTGSDDDEGNAIYIVNAVTGDLIWKATGSGTGDTGPVSDTEFYHADMKDSIPSKMVAVNATNTSNIYDDRAYVGDTGGVIWRVDFVSTDRMQWQVTQLADIGRHDTPDLQSEDRRFFHASDIVFSSDAFGAYDAVVIGSGNRAHPLSIKTHDYLYVVKDRYVASVPNYDEMSLDYYGGPFTHSGVNGLEDLSNNCLQDDDPADCVGYDEISQSLPNLVNGWKIKLVTCNNENIFGDCGEKSLSQPFVLLGRIIFNSYVPAVEISGDPVCAPAEGSGQSYAINLQNASAIEDFNSANNSGGVVKLDRSFRLDSGGIPSDPVFAGDYDPSGIGGGGGGGGGGGCSEAIGILLPDLKIDLLCGVGLLKKYWYTTEPE